MGKIMAVDFGTKRCGIAVTDDLQIIASGLETVDTEHIFQFMKKYFSDHQVEAIVIGLPVDLKGNLSEVEVHIQAFIRTFEEKYPEVKVHRFDERFTSKMASFYISQSGKNKKKKENKALIDMVSATLILQNFLEQQQR